MQEITLHARQKKLLSLLNAKHGTESGKELAAKLGVSERTVRGDIKEMNQKLADFGIQIEPQYGRGYRLSVENRAVYLQLFSEKETLLTRDDRIRTLLLFLIRAEDWCDLGDLEDEMFVSRSTLENDLRIMRRRVSLRHPYLQLVRNGNLIQFENDEAKKRAILIRHYAENWDYDSRDGIILRQDEFGRELLEQIQGVLKTAIYKNRMELDDFGFIYMVLSIAVLWFRVRTGHVIVFEDSSDLTIPERKTSLKILASNSLDARALTSNLGETGNSDLDDSGENALRTVNTDSDASRGNASSSDIQKLNDVEANVKDGNILDSDDTCFCVIRTVLDELQELWNLKLPPAEYAWLSGIFGQILIVNRRDLTREEVKMRTDSVCQGIVERALKDVKAFYGVDFTDDAKLFVDLTVHVQSLKNGIVAPQLQRHVFGDELRSRYFLMGDIAHFLRLRLERECELALWEDEEDYLLPFLISAQRTLYEKVRGAGIATAVISHFDRSMTHFLMEQLRKYYGDVLDLRGPYPVHRKEESNADQPMLILTTVHMEDFRRLPNAPVLTVSPLLEREDRQKIEGKLTEIRCRLLFAQPERPLKEYFCPELIFSMDNKDSLSAVISAIQDRFYERNYMVEKIAVNLESDYFAVLPNGTLLIYQMDAHIPQTIGSFVRLKKTLSWKKMRNIRAVMFLALKPEDGKLLGWFYHLAVEWTD